MGLIEGGIDEFADDDVDGSDAAIRDKLDIVKTPRCLISGFAGRRKQNQNERRPTRSASKRGSSGNYGCAKYTRRGRPNVPVISTSAAFTSSGNIEGEDGEKTRCRVGGVGRALTTLARAPKDTVARRTALARRLYPGWCDSARRIALGVLLLNGSRGADILDIVHFMYLAVGDSILLRIGDDLYMRDGPDMAKIGGLAPAEILAQCALYSKMVAGLLRNIGAIGCVSRVEADILNHIDIVYYRCAIYGVTSDSHMQSEHGSSLSGDVRMDLHDGGGYGCDIAESSPVFRCLIDMGRLLKKPNPERCTSWAYNAELFLS